jgi:hypothetical protein
MDNDLINFNFQPNRLIDEASSDEFYIGLANNGNDQNAEYWQIQKIIKIGNVWNFQFPEGSQNFNYKWGDRYTYIYS